MNYNYNINCNTIVHASTIHLSVIHLLNVLILFGESGEVAPRVICVRKEFNVMNA